jgi:hypothetical protein
MASNGCLYPDVATHLVLLRLLECYLFSELFTPVLGVE